MRKLKLLGLGAVLAAALFVGCTGGQKVEPTKTSSANVINEEELGLRKETLYSEKTVRTAVTDYNCPQPGQSEKIERSFENAPPMIPHTLDGMIPITRDTNACASCHLPEVAAAVGATAVPKTHLMDLRTGKDNQGLLSGARYNCTQCHAPQANVPLTVSNKFRPEFREKDSASKSSLINTLNEGVQ